MAPGLVVRNSESAPLAEVPRLDIGNFRVALIEAVRNGCRVSALFGAPSPAGRVSLYAVLADDKAGSLSIFSAEVKGEYPSITPDCPEVHLFER